MVGRELEFEVIGSPSPRKRPRAARVGSGIRIYADIDKVWRDLVANAARRAASDWSHPIDRPVAIEYEFRFVRPKSASRRWPCIKPDIDNLEGAVNDAITYAGIWTDDALVVDSRTRKIYAATAGALIRIWSMDGQAMASGSKRSLFDAGSA